MYLRELKEKSPKELLTWAEDLGVEEASSMRVQDLVFDIINKITIICNFSRSSDNCIKYTFTT